MPTCGLYSIAKKQCTIEEHLAPVQWIKCKIAEEDNMEAGLSKGPEQVVTRSKGVGMQEPRVMQEVSTELHAMREDAAEGWMELVSAICIMGKGFNTFLLGVLEPIGWQGLPL